MADVEIEDAEESMELVMEAELEDPDDDVALSVSDAKLVVAEVMAITEAEVDGVLVGCMEDVAAELEVMLGNDVDVCPVETIVGPAVVVPLSVTAEEVGVTCVCAIVVA